MDEGLVVAAGGSQLHAADWAGDGNDWDAGEAERGGVAQQAAAGLTVIGAGGETADGDGG